MNKRRIKKLIKGYLKSNTPFLIQYDNKLTDIVIDCTFHSLHKDPITFKSLSKIENAIDIITVNKDKLYTSMYLEINHISKIVRLF